MRPGLSIKMAVTSRRSRAQARFYLETTYREYFLLSNSVRLSVALRASPDNCETSRRTAPVMISVTAAGLADLTFDYGDWFRYLEPNYANRR